MRRITGFESRTRRCGRGGAVTGTPNRFLPDKAIDLVDEAAARAAIEIDSVPVEIDDLERRRILQLEIEQVALEKETDEREQGAAGWLRASSPSSTRGRHEEAALGGGEGAIAAIRTLKEELEQLRTQVEREGDLNVAAEIHYGEIPELEQRIADATEHLDELQRENRMLKEEVDAEDIAEVVSKWTGVPVSRLMEAEAAKLIHLEDAPARARRRPGRRRHRGGQRHPPQPRPGCPTRTGRSARSCSSVRPASARPSWRGRSPSSCSTTSRRWCAST